MRRVFVDSRLIGEVIRQLCLIAQLTVVILKVKVGFLPYKAEHIHGRNEPSFSVGRAWKI